jgi:hypothetical protein
MGSTAQRRWQLGFVAAFLERLMARVWTPAATRGPKVIERGGVLRPAPGVVINLSRDSAQAPEKGTPKPPGRTPRPSASPSPAGRPRFIDWMARVSPLLARRIPWRHLTGGSA